MNKNDILIIMGDFSARMGSKRMDYSVMGPYGFKQRNDTGEQLLDLCFANHLYRSKTKLIWGKLSRCWRWANTPGKHTDTHFTILFCVFFIILFTLIYLPNQPIIS